MFSKKVFLSRFLTIFLIFSTIFTRFYKLNWDHGYHFHPDENNIVSLANSIKLPISNLNFFTKGTFSYGSTTAYLAFWTAHVFRQNSAFIVYFLRFLSALCSSATILAIYWLCNKNWGKNIAYLSSIFLIFSPGLIQSAHFGTFESILTFLYVIIFCCCLEINENPSNKYLFLSSVPLAFATALKINSLVFFPIIVFLYFFKSLNKRNIGSKIISIMVFSVNCLWLTVVLSPYYLTSNFFSMLNYEQQIVRGTLDVFYTRSFIGSMPIFFDFTHILPWLTSPFISFIFPFLLILSIAYSFKNKNLLLVFIFVLFIPSAFLFTKWSRYLLPSIPFIVVFICIIIDKIKSSINKYIIITFVIFQIFWGILFLGIYFQEDTRIVASNWINNNIADKSFILSETGNVVNLPIYQSEIEKNVENFDFYNLDFDPNLRTQLINYLLKADYIIVPSRRIFANMGHLPDKYPLVSRYYQSLFSGSLGFTQIAQFSSFIKFGPFFISDEFAEETWSVFDHPVIRIYQKTQKISLEQYENIFKK